MARQFLHAAFIAGCVVSAAAAAAAGATSKSLPALSRLQPGLWQVRELGNPQASSQSICLADPAMLMQLQHKQAPCSRLVIANDFAAATVHYTCPANGFGRTSIRVETPRLAKIDTQGIIGKAPFAFRAEAKHLGACPARTAGR